MSIVCLQSYMELEKIDQPMQLIWKLNIISITEGEYEKYNFSEHLFQHLYIAFFQTNFSVKLLLKSQSLNMHLLNIKGGKYYIYSFDQRSKISSSKSTGS